MELSLSLPPYFLVLHSDCPKILDHFYWKVSRNHLCVPLDQTVLSALISTLPETSALFPFNLAALNLSPFQLAQNTAAKTCMIACQSPKLWVCSRSLICEIQILYNWLFWPFRCMSLLGIWANSSPGLLCGFLLCPLPSGCVGTGSRVNAQLYTPLFCIVHALFSWLPLQEVHPDQTRMGKSHTPSIVQRKMDLFGFSTPKYLPHWQQIEASLRAPPHITQNKFS